MKKYFFAVSVFVAVIFISCNNSENKNGKTGEIPKTHVDSLLDAVLEGHDAGMAKMGKLSTMQNKVQHFLDSLNKLSGKSKKVSSNFKTSLDSLLSELKSAQEEMNKWMDEFNMDSATNNVDLRTQYLESEKIIVTKIKENMLSVLQKADSLLKQ